MKRIILLFLGLLIASSSQAQFNFWHAMTNNSNMKLIDSATGGTITYDGKFKIHTFTTSGNFNFISGKGPINILVIAGGGGGALGAGQSNFYTSATGNHAGGSGGFGYTSSISGISTVYASGGRGGSSNDQTGASGLPNTGNGGGAVYAFNPAGIRYQYMK